MRCHQAPVSLGLLLSTIPLRYDYILCDDFLSLWSCYTGIWYRPGVLLSSTCHQSHYRLMTPPEHLSAIRKTPSLKNLGIISVETQG